ncbi:hypothetical protein F5148DRAFT_898393 [Russula earlei]|uniref:Uncharacterized protein n=1 Tax=Russula earlei TaxID=71964 RepID=A0ACC0UM51_9AGAM|nr:hypothetical protein F5148DRAFT_898393 [Russula earlei]
MSTSGSGAKRGESMLAEEWQLQILWELHQKLPHPTVEQRRLLATQTGLDVKWITRWFMRVNRASKSKPRPTATTSTKVRITSIGPVNSANMADATTTSGASPCLLSGAMREFCRC